MLQVAGRRRPWRCCASDSRVETRFRRQEGNRHRPGARGAGRPGREGASRRDRDAEQQRQPGCAQQAGASARRNLPTAASWKATPRCGSAAAAAVADIDRWRSFYSGIETLFFGLSLGSVLVLIAIGLAITFGVMGVINMAHGELMMLGAYTTYAVQMAMPRTYRNLHPGRHSGGVPRGRPDRRADGAHHHPLSLRTAARDAARDVRRQPDSAADGAVDFLGAQPLGDHTANG